MESPDVTSAQCPVPSAPVWASRTRQCYGPTGSQPAIWNMSVLDSERSCDLLSRNAEAATPGAETALEDELNAH